MSKQIQLEPQLINKMIDFIQSRPWKESNGLMNEILTAIKKHNEVNNEIPTSAPTTDKLHGKPKRLQGGPAHKQAGLNGSGEPAQL